ncbi:hypothetical protein [Aureimonas sp. AU20]|uniref:hypothetical protein n=1 Tax=Aureimonas sp. AU20 TaxID=1349819 RepID=UPI00071F4C5E|nr:hypothetical protein [Aureimonas sp. AU20]ALN73819.1 hypothetical protein M673_13920 [Aureimonas sp. AU20]
MSPEWVMPAQSEDKRPMPIGRRLAIVASATLLSGAAASFAVSLVPPVHRARIEMSAEGGPLPSWTAAEIQVIADREPGLDTGPGLTLERGADGSRSLLDLVGQPRGPLEGAASRRTGIQVLSGTKSVVWAEAPSADQARVRVQFIADQLLARAPKPARQVEPASPPPAPPVADADIDGRLARAEARVTDAERQLADFDARPAPSAEPVVSASPPVLLDPSQKAALESRRAELDAAIAAVEGDDEQKDMPGSWGGWDAWRALMRERRGLRPRAEELAASLNADHPRVRIVRLRLQQLDSEIATRHDTLLTQLEAQRDANAAALRLLTEQKPAPVAQPTTPQQTAAERARERADLFSALVSARADLARLRDEAEVLSALATPAFQPPPEPASAGAPAIRQKVLPLTTRSLSLWPAALAGGVVGFLGSAFFVALAMPLRRMKGKDATGSVGLPLEPVPAPEIPGHPDVAMVDDVIEALKFSAVARAVVVSAASADTRTLGVDIGRRLALRGRSVLVVDLSEAQDGARAMGLPADTRGLFDLARGDANFAEIARRDFATGAEIVASGHRLDDESRPGLWSERRHALDFMERSYETLVIDCGRIDAPFLGAILDPEAALLVWVEGCSEREIEAATSQLKAKGFADMILVRDQRPN